MAKNKTTSLASDDVIPGIMHVHRIHVAAALGNKDQIMLYLAGESGLIELLNSLHEPFGGVFFSQGFSLFISCSLNMKSLKYFIYVDELCDFIPHSTPTVAGSSR